MRGWNTSSMYMVGKHLQGIMNNRSCCIFRCRLGAQFNIFSLCWTPSVFHCKTATANYIKSKWVCNSGDGFWHLLSFPSTTLTILTTLHPELLPSCLASSNPFIFHLQEKKIMTWRNRIWPNVSCRKEPQSETLLLMFFVINDRNGTSWP